MITTLASLTAIAILSTRGLNGNHLELTASSEGRDGEKLRQMAGIDINHVEKSRVIVETFAALIKIQQGGRLSLGTLSRDF